MVLLKFCVLSKTNFCDQTKPSIDTGKVCGIIYDVKLVASEVTVLYLKNDALGQNVKILMNIPNNINQQNKSEYYLGREFCVTGELMKHKNNYYILVHRQSQIKPVMSDNVLQSMH